MDKKIDKIANEMLILIIFLDAPLARTPPILVAAVHQNAAMF